jgi:hypothetical protein
MGCEQFGQQACAENDRTADKLALMLDRNDPTQSADAIRQELYDRPPSLAIDLINRIQNYDQLGQGADLKVDPMISRVPSRNGGYDYVDTGDREVVVESDQGRERIAILRGAPEQRYPSDDSGYPRDYPPQYPQRFPMQRGFDPLSMITSLFIGGMMNGQFSRWMHQPRRDHWQDQGGRTWYPNSSGQWGLQQQPQWGQRPPYMTYDRNPLSNQDIFRRSQDNQFRQPWRGQGQTQDQDWRYRREQDWRQRQDQSQDWRQRQGQDWRREQPGQQPPNLQQQEWLRRRLQQQQETRPPIQNRDGRWPQIDRHPRQNQETPGRNWGPARDQDRQPRLPEQNRQPRIHIPEQRPEQRFQRPEPRPEQRLQRPEQRPEQHLQRPEQRFVPRQEQPRIQPRPEQHQPRREMPQHVPPVQQQPGQDRRRQR